MATASTTSSSTASRPTPASRQVLEAYKRDGTFLWRVDMGPNSRQQDNIEPGSSTISVGNWDGVTVYDLDSDGKAEVIISTANGVVFGDGHDARRPATTTTSSSSPCSTA